MSRFHFAAALLAGALSTSILVASPAVAATRTDADVDALLKTLPVSEASATAIAARCDGIYTLSNRAKTELEARKGAATLKDDFAAFDTLLLGLGDGFNEMYLISQTSTSKRMAATAYQRRPAADTAIAGARGAHRIGKDSRSWREKVPSLRFTESSSRRLRSGAAFDCGEKHAKRKRSFRLPTSCSWARFLKSLMTRIAHDGRERRLRYEVLDLRM